jgi:hypothetical protein
MAALTFLEAFNAKELPTPDVVASFVPSAKFQELAGNWHALLIGPRGSGKTTYLRMLELNALRFWEHAEADNYRKAIPYTGVYIPADITWGAMVDALGGGKLNTETHQAFANAAFCTNVLQASVEAMRCKFQRTNNAPFSDYQFSEISPDLLETVVRDIADAWCLSIKTLSFQGLLSAIGRRLIDIKSDALKVAADPKHTLHDAYERANYLSLAFDAAITFAFNEIDRVAGCPNGKWALLFDEFEIAPPRIQQLVLSKLRSTNPKILYKVALAPCGPHTQQTLDTMAKPSSNNDYKSIDLWQREKLPVTNFCEQLFLAKIKAFEPLRLLTPVQFFGKTDHDNEGDLLQDIWKSRYELEFLELARKDITFHEFLLSKQINSAQLDVNESIIRKIAPLVAFRNAHRNFNGGSKKGRKKLFFAYTGWQAVAAITEGNPRWFIGILNMMASQVTDAMRMPISSTIQHDQLSAASETFAAMLKTAATEQAMGITTNVSIYSLLADIGRYFNERLINDPFIEEFPLSFEIDDRVSADRHNALRIAFNLGAIVCLSEPDTIGGYATLIGKRFRLAYMLAPNFRLPLRATKSIALSTILCADKKTQSIQGQLL